MTRGRVFATHIYSVDQSTGVTVADSLTLDTGIWYDARGHTIKQTQPGGLVTKFGYDGAGRLLTTFHSDGGGDTGYGDADDVTGDTVYEEVWNQYDANGNVLKTTTKQRFHDATGTGPLQVRTTNPKARISYAGMYYDLADRLVAQVNETTNGGSAWTWSSTIPTRSATELTRPHEKGTIMLRVTRWLMVLAAVAVFAAGSAHGQQPTRSTYHTATEMR